MTPDALGRALRKGQEDALCRRRSILGLSLFNIGAMSLLGLYQMGMLKRVPEPPGFNAEKVNGSAQGYGILSAPDAVLAVVSYAGTAALASIGPPDRARTMPLAALATGAKTLADAALALGLLTAQPIKYRAFSFWSVLSAGAVVAAAHLAWPETRAALDTLRGEKP